MCGAFMAGLYRRLGLVAAPHAGGDNGRQGEIEMAKKKAARRPLKVIKDAVVKTMKNVFGTKTKTTKKKTAKKKTTGKKS